MNKKTTIFITAGVVLIGLFFLGSKLYKSSQIEEYKFLAEKNNELFVRDHSPRYGNSKARVYVIEFLDPECESCRAFYPKVKSLLEEYGDRVQLVVRYAPFHGNSVIAIKALEAARLQGKYWEALELLFKEQPKWGDHHHPRPELIFEYLPQLGLDMDRLRKDMESPKIMKVLEQDVADLRALQVRGTPTFFVNGKPLDSFGLGSLKSLISREVKAVYP